ncbi:MAG: hypothetical protein H6Q89_4345 [Myxococcaceae bacterium]|nr:hypothetical protein [Myxococcaceae bacterium]
MRGRLIAAGLALGYAGLIFFLSAQSSFPVPKGIWTADKLLHGIEYAILAFLIARAAVDPGEPKGSGAAVLAAIAASLYGVSDELHQSFVPGRSPDVYDALADAVGSGLGAAAFTFHRRRGWRVKRGT